MWIIRNSKSILPRLRIVLQWTLTTYPTKKKSQHSLPIFLHPSLIVARAKAAARGMRTLVRGNMLRILEAASSLLTTSEAALWSPCPPDHLQPRSTSVQRCLPQFTAPGGASLGRNTNWRTNSANPISFRRSQKSHDCHDEHVNG